MFQCVSEDGDETCVIRRLSGEIGIVLLAGKEGRLVSSLARDLPEPSPRPRRLPG